MADLSRSAQTAPRSLIRLMGDAARRVPDALKLYVGDPDFDTPEHIIEAAARAGRDGFTRYTPSGGLQTLRELLVEKVRVRNGIDCAAEQVIVTTGGAGALFTTFMTIVDPGDEVLIPDPGWTNYPPMLHTLGARWTGYRMDPAEGFEPHLDALEELVGPRTRGILVNSPGNPTGAVFRRETLEALVDFAERHDLWIVSDECYDEMVFEGEHISMATLGAPERTISIFSFSKSYAMTGWRLGYAVAPAAVAPALAKAQEPVVSNTSSVVQKAGEAALTGPQDCVRVMRDAYRSRRDAAAGRLDAGGIGYILPHGAFYLMVDVSPAGDADTVARRLLEEERVAVVPGTAFGATGEGFVRIALSVAQADIEEGLERLARLVVRAAA
jgi:aspartate aminotransferase